MRNPYESIRIETDNGSVTVPAVICRGALGVRVSGVYFTASELRRIADQVDAMNARLDNDYGSSKKPFHPQAQTTRLSVYVYEDGSVFPTRQVDRNDNFVIRSTEYCSVCKKLIQPSFDEPFAHCDCGTTEWFF